MRHSRSGLRGRARLNEAHAERSASEQARRDPGASEFHLSSLMNAIRLDELVEQAPEAVAILSPEDRVVGISKEFARLFGYTQDEVYGRYIQDLIVPETLLESARENLAQVRRGQRVDVETLRRRKDGTDVQVSLVGVPVRTASGENILSYVIYHDITERKHAEAQLIESEARFRTMADKAPVLIWTSGTDGLCDYFSRPWLEFTGRTMEQEVGAGWTQGVHPDDLQTALDTYWPAFHARKPFRMEYRLRRADGEYRWVIESGVPRYTGVGEFAGYIGSNIDVTDLKRLEEERERLRQLQVELAHRNRVATMGELTASLAHEINQPITGAASSGRACVKWLQREIPNVTEACEAASAMVADITRAADIIDGIRSLYRRGTPRRELVDVNEIITEMTVLLTGTANRSSISIRIDLYTSLPTITADRVQLQQVLMNLMLNGIEAMKDIGGELVVGSNKTEDNQLLVSVRDSGIGLPAGSERMFTAFFTTKPQGTGMGLAISRSIIESHGGRLWASANTGRGATFHFTLPLEQAGAMTATQQASSA
jgi:PAS domain S-box-containing protein